MRFSSWASAVWLALAFIFTSPPANASASLLTHQQWAHLEAGRDGGVFHDTYQAIVQKESGDCRLKHKYDPSAWGCAQLHLRTARQYVPSVTIHDLMTNDALNLAIGALFLKHCMGEMETWALGVACYHYGEPTAEGMTPADAVADPYVSDIRSHVRRTHATNH